MDNNQSFTNQCQREIQVAAVREVFAEVKALLINAGFLALLIGAVLYLGLSFLLFIAPAFLWGMAEAAVKIFKADKIVQAPEKFQRAREAFEGN